MAHSKQISEDWKDSHDYKQAIFAANKLLDEPYADPDDDPRTVARQFLRMIERYETAERRGEERERERMEDYYLGYCKEHNIPINRDYIYDMRKYLSSLKPTSEEEIIK